MKIFNKKGMTLMEIMVVVLLIAGMASMVYPSYLSSVEKAKSSEAVKIVGHAIASMRQYFEDNMAYPQNFSDLDFTIAGKGVSITGGVANTTNFQITLNHNCTSQENGSICAKRCKQGTCKYNYRIRGHIQQDFLECLTMDEAYDKKICSTIGKGNASPYIIE